MEQPPIVPVVPPVLEPSPVRPSRTVLISALVLLVLIALGAYFIFFFPPSARYVSEMFSALTVPDDLKDARFISIDASGSKTYQLEQGRLVPAERDPSTPAIPSVFKDTTSSTTRTSPAATSDGRIAAFAEVAGKQLLASPLDWRVALAFQGSSVRKEVGIGFAPFFIDDTHVARFTSTGVVSNDLVTGTETLLIQHPFPNALVRIVHSPDGSVVAWSENDSILIYRVSPASMEPIATVADGAVSFALSDQMLYTVHRTSHGTEISQYQLTADPKQKTALYVPTRFAITDIRL